MLNSKNSCKTIINFKNIYAGYEQTPVLKDVNLEIKLGEHWAILGANGGGKSTLIKLMSNDLYPSPKYPFVKEVFGKADGVFLILKKI